MSVLIDTSCWIEALRNEGNPAIQQQVKHLLLSGEAAVCDMILLELWNGARGQYQKDQLRRLETTLIHLPIDKAVWDKTKELASLCREKGLNVPATDLLIVAISLRHDAPLVHADRHFDLVLNAVTKKPQR